MKTTYHLLKRIFDAVLSGAAILALLPLFLVISALILLDSPGPVIFSQKRVGKNKVFFNIYKFRTMRADAPRDIPTHLMVNPETYTTKVGAFLRKTSLDELPQLFNILKGDMSLVGPRPALWNQDDLVAARDRYGANSVTPGLTGWAQINGRDELSIAEKARLDGIYAENMSLRLDAWCILGTIGAVLSEKGFTEGYHEEKPVDAEFSDELVSVVMPAYNASAFIGAAIRSVTRQTHKNWELIIADDCSRDDTAAVAEKYAARDSRIKVIRLADNTGPAAARNAALAVVSGRFIAFLDADDLWMPRKLEKQLTFMKEKNAALSYTGYALIGEDGKRTGHSIHSKPEIRHEELLKNTIIGCLTVMVDREKTGDFRMPSLVQAQDMMTWRELLKRGNFIAYGMPDILSLYRVSGKSLSGDKITASRKQWDVYRNYCGFGFLKSSYYFSCYAINAVRKRL